MNNPGLGRCHSCGKEDRTVRNLLMHYFKSPVPGTGWGCVVCDLPSDGASSVICDECLENKKMPIFCYEGYPAQKKMIKISDIKKIRHEHDLSKHPEINADDI